ncbi:MAG: indole-3-glycerol-phosphate synthase [Candidatus Hydrogenedentota bacterium]|nr:MAG: indole-3-glycerol-phosphate synthase [Candidatus Hydrogenedentota bacterium]
MSVLLKITESRKESIAKEKVYANREMQPTKRSFLQALSRGQMPALIAELKRKSPSKGEIRPGATVRQVYEWYRPYASAISVLTEPNYFGGSLDDIAKMRELTDKPILRKDFLTDPIQVYAARYFGADAFLVIVSAVSDNQLQELLAAGNELNMDALVETESPEDIERAAAAKARIIGFNNRNLHTLSVDVKRCSEALPLLLQTGAKKLVAESGFSTREDLETLPQEFDAVLMGTTLMQAKDPAAKLKELFR